METFLRMENVPNGVGEFALKFFEPTKTETISSDPLGSYIESLEGATKAFQFVCASIGKHDHSSGIDALKNYYIKQIKAIDSNLSVAEKLRLYQKQLVKYVQHLEFELAKIPAKDLAFEKPSKWLAKADQYVNLTTIRPRLVSVFKLGGITKDHYLVQIEPPQSPMNDDVLQEYLDTTQASITQQPAWYMIMKPFEKALFNHAMSEILSRDSENPDKLAVLRANITSISSRLRTIPGLPNFSKHEAFIVDSEGDLIHKLPSNLRSSVVSPRDLISDADATKLNLRDNFTEKNIQLIIKNQHTSGSKPPILLQTLISPQAPDFTRKPDKQLFSDKNKAINTILDKAEKAKDNSFTPENVFYTNHPVNHARHVAQTTDQKEIGSSQTTPPSINALILYAKKYTFNLKEDTKLSENEIARLNLIDFCSKALNIAKSETYTTALESHDDPHNRELYIASLELLLVSLMGGVAHSSCVSGKDRRAILAIFTDSIAIYQYYYPADSKNKNDSTNDDLMTMLKSENFIAIFTSIYNSGHHQANAAQNAQGACGIKTPQIYLSDNLIEALGKDRILQDNRLASNNEYDHLLEKQPNTSLIHALAGGLTGFGVGSLLIGGAISLSLILPPVGISLIIFATIAAGVVLASVFLGSFLGYTLSEGEQTNDWDAIKVLANTFRDNEKTNNLTMNLQLSIPKSSINQSQKIEITLSDHESEELPTQEEIESEVSSPAFKL